VPQVNSQAQGLGETEAAVGGGRTKDERTGVGIGFPRKEERMPMGIWWCVLKDSIDIVLKETGFMKANNTAKVRQWETIREQ
jgi:hypothetical protein